MSDHIPPLPHGCNSWVAVRRASGEVIGEFWERSNVERFDPAKVEIRTTLAHLQSLNGAGQ